jgi:hypothetical protein
MVAIDQRGLDAHVEPAVDQGRRADEPDGHAHLARGLDVVRREPLDALVVDIAQGDPDPKATVARMAIFAAASAPETSSVGSASANPRD